MSRFDMKQATDRQYEEWVRILEGYKTLEYIIENCFPKSRETSIAMTKLEESAGWLNSALPQMLQSPTVTDAVLQNMKNHISRGSSDDAIKAKEIIDNAILESLADKP